MIEAKDKEARLILIGGGTCSGKTTMAKAIGKRLSSLKTVIVSHDNYYSDLSHVPLDEVVRVNFDHPKAIDLEYLIADVIQMLTGTAVTIPDYDFVTHKRMEGNTCIAEAEVVILEGIFALYYEELLALADLKIFVDTDADLRLVRRVYRDISERGFVLERVLDQYLDTVKPSHDAFIEPTKKNADIIIPGEKDFENVLYMLNGYLLYDLIRRK
ncbi:MAG: uridine kinase [Candidatus Cloacimonetes bacterium]|nr:uridine kinase [Candidatus Cloacimonadota bacterium]